ncbi:unnamed protein product [Rhizophagus irregularis]|nr:unnamed protein product [Rhizophagus irregularis]
MKYRNNAKAWMITTFFQEWIQDFDHQVAQKHGGQRVLLLLDNCTSHKLEGLTLSHVDVHFLPPNTTSKIQPMDSGIIMSFKKHYRHHHICWILEQIEAGEFIQDLKMDVLQAIQYIIKSWNEVTAETIYNCWNHTGILPDTEFLDNIEDDDSIFNEIFEILETLNLPNSMDAEEFLNIPKENIVYEIPKDNQIITELVEMFKKKSDENTDDLDEMDDSTEVVPVSIKVALKSLKKLHTFLLQQEDTNKRAPSSYENESKIQITEFKCNNATEEICNKVKDTILIAGKIISKTFILKSPIFLSVNYTNLCIVQPDLYAAQLVREILLLDDDGLSQYYSQSLVKQYQFKKHPEFALIDIITIFNSIVNWHFPSDSDIPIQPK